MESEAKGLDVGVRVTNVTFSFKDEESLWEDHEETQSIEESKWFQEPYQS